MSENIERYPYVKAWAKFLGSTVGYADIQVQRAIQDDAPIDAVYYVPEEARWLRAAEITNDNIRKEIYALVARQRLADMQGNIQ